MTAPYYQDDAVTLYQGRCEEVLPGLSLSGSVHLLTDPPYFKVKDDAWDNQWGKAAEFLDWMGEWLDLVKPHLSADASVWVFASPELTSAVESVVAGRFRVLNSVRWVKEGGDNLRRVSLPAMRSFVSIWEGIVFAGNHSGEWEPYLVDLGAQMRAARKLAGKTDRDLGQLMPGYRNPESAAANIRNWELGKNLPSERDWEWFHTAIAAPARAYGAVIRDYERIRRPFTVATRRLSEDIWHFPSVAKYPGKHPCEKPPALLTHMIETTTRPGDTIIDCFAGSGAVLDVARQLGRKAVGIEMDAHWCRQIEKRLSQQTFDFGEIA